MPNYEALFFFLFSRVSDALEALKNGDYLRAEDILQQAQRETEDKYSSGLS